MAEKLAESMPDTFQGALPFHALGMTRDDIAHGMGYADGAGATYFADELDALLAQASAHVDIQAGFRVFAPDTVTIEREGFRVEDQYFETGRIIAGPLKGVETLAFFAATAGAGLTQWMQSFMREGDLLKAYFVDALGSETVEKAADWLEGKLIAWAGERGQATTNRYSPGYCGWSVSEQHQFFSLLPDGFCGIALTESALMQPEKSVSGVVGIGGRAKRVDYACNICTVENCFRRRIRPDQAG